MLLNTLLFIDFQEILIILIAFVLLFGPNSLPEIARTLGAAVRKFKVASEEIKEEILNPKDINNTLKEVEDQFNSSLNSVENNITKEVKEIEDVLDPFQKRIQRNDS